MSDQIDITTTLQSLYALLDELRSMDAADVLSTPYHPTLEAAYAALGQLETEIDALGQELEYHHQRLDSARDIALAEATQGPNTSLNTSNTTMQNDVNPQ